MIVDYNDYDDGDDDDDFQLVEFVWLVHVPEDGMVHAATEKCTEVRAVYIECQRQCGLQPHLE